jgi:hypothetical protein
MNTPDIGLHPDAVNLASIAGAGVKNHRTTRVRLQEHRIKKVRESLSVRQILTFGSSIVSYLVVLTLYEVSQPVLPKIPIFLGSHAVCMSSKHGSSLFA